MLLFKGRRRLLFKGIRQRSEHHRCQSVLRTPVHVRSIKRLVTAPCTCAPVRRTWANRWQRAYGA